ncbi:acyl carrier protein [Alphaproteobacteria bacterium]|nr:acyl carrier protein [Alphaproteobacteria bacterium]
MEKVAKIGESTLTTCISAILSRCLNIPAEQVTSNLTLNGVWQWDSLAHLELMMFIEKNHGVSINEESIIECSSVEGLSKVLGLEL